MTEKQSEVIVMESDSEGEASDSDSSYDSDEFRTLAGQADVILFFIGGITGLGYAGGVISELNIPAIRTTLESLGFGLAIIPLLAGVLAQLGIQAYLDDEDIHLEPKLKGRLIALPVALLTISAGIPVSWAREVAIVVSVLIIAGAGIFWGWIAKDGIMGTLFMLVGLATCVIIGLLVGELVF